MKEIGEVVRKEGSKAVIRFHGSSHCATCKVGCPSKGKERFIEVVDSAGVKVGDLVEVEFSEKKLLLGAFLSYIFPLIFFFAGYFAGSLVLSALKLKAEAIAVASSFAFMFFGYFLIKKAFDVGLLKSSEFEPKLVRKIGA